MTRPRHKVAACAPPLLQRFHFIKAGHHYLFQYQKGTEHNLASALLTQAVDPRLNIEIDDALQLLKTLNLHPGD